MSRHDKRYRSEAISPTNGLYSKYEIFLINILNSSVPSTNMGGADQNQFSLYATLAFYKFEHLGLEFINL